MSRTLSIEQHLTSDELAARYRRTHDPIEKTHWQMLWLLAQGRTTAEVASICGYHVQWVRRLVHRYNAHGADGLHDQRHTNPGHVPLLNASLQAELDQALDLPPADGGLWTGPKVAVWISAHIGRPVGKQRGWEYLQRLQRRPKVPRPRHVLADPQEQAEFIKKTPQQGG